MKQLCFFILLDEATSALDPQTAREIEDNLLRKEDLTLLTITHKLKEDMLKQYDILIYMEKGNIKEIGSYEELFKKEGGFYRFHLA